MDILYNLLDLACDFNTQCLSNYVSSFRCGCDNICIHFEDDTGE